MNRKFLITTVLLFFTVLLTKRELNAQLLDNEVWFEVNASIDLFKNANLDVETGYRRMEDFGTTKMLYFQTGFEYEIIKNLEVDLSYRYSYIPDPGPDENRLAGALSYELDLGKLDIQYRFKYQEDYPAGEVKSPAIRNRLEFDYNLSKQLDPYLLFEVFYDNKPDQKEFEQIRASLGVELDLPKGKDFTVFYMLQNRFNVNTPGNTNVFGFVYSFGDLN